ncbi:MAG: FliM/FliN family flagellar motor switch protein [Acidobacteriia bacterium]|nr:FliM/FliN family flagellar motor switch protein [Terriglobia bacterium]
MEKILSQDEIDALFRATQQGQIPKGAAKAEQRDIKKFDLRVVGQISMDQMSALSTLHEIFARNITNSLGAYLRVGFDVNLVSVEQLSYSEVLSRLPDLTYICSIRVRPLEALALLQMDLPLAFPVMDLVLGGPGNGSVELRDLTEIEEQILESVVRILMRELQTCWAPVVEVEFGFDQQLHNSQAMAMMPPTERTLALSFEIKMPEAHGMLNVTLPAVASNALFRKLTAQSSYYKHASSSAHLSQLRTQMLDGEFLVDLRLPPVPVRVRDLTELQPGQVLPLRLPVDQPVNLLVAGKEMFLAYPVACGNSRGGQILHRNSILPASRKAAS